MFSLWSPFNTKREKLEPAFFARSPATTKFAKQPIRLEQKYEEILTQDYAKSHKFVWTDSMLVTPEARDAIWGDKVHDKSAISSVEACLHEPLDSLVICDINPLVGKGVFLAPEAQPLPAGTVIGIYAGELYDGSVDSFLGKVDDYAMAFNCEEHAPSVLSQTIPYLSASANQHRNITSFIQDAPDEFQLETMKVNSEKPLAKENIATANLLLQSAVYKGCPISYLITARVIMPGEQLLFAYGGTFWNKKKRCVFNKDGLIIGSFKTPNEIELNSDYEPTKHMSAPRLDIPAAQKIAYSLIEPKKDSFDPCKRLIADVLSSIEVYSNRYETASEEGKYIHRLRNAFDNNDPIASRFNQLHAALADTSCQTLLNQLGTLRSELIFHMKKYQATKQKSLLSAPSIAAREINNDKTSISSSCPNRT